MRGGPSAATHVSAQPCGCMQDRLLTILLTVNGASGSVSNARLRIPVAASSAGNAVPPLSLALPFWLASPPRTAGVSTGGCAALRRSWSHRQHRSRPAPVLSCLRSSGGSAATSPLAASNSGTARHTVSAANDWTPAGCGESRAACCAASSGRTATRSTLCMEACTCLAAAALVAVPCVSSWASAASVAARCWMTRRLAAAAKTGLCHSQALSADAALLADASPDNRQHHVKCSLRACG